MCGQTDGGGVSSKGSRWLLAIALAALAVLVVALLQMISANRRELEERHRGRVIPSPGAAPPRERGLPGRRPVERRLEHPRQTRPPAAAEALQPRSTLSPTSPQRKRRLAGMQRRARALARLAAMRRRLRSIDAELAAAKRREKPRPHLEQQRKQVQSVIRATERALARSSALPTHDPTVMGKGARPKHHIRKTSPIERP